MYRITNTNEDGFVTELSYPQIEDFCDEYGLTPSFLFYYGKAMELYPKLELGDHWNENFVEKLQVEYNEKDCFMSNNKVPEEGVVVRKDALFRCESYKLKSARFLNWESKQLDEGVEDIETSN